MSKKYTSSNFDRLLSEDEVSSYMKSTEEDKEDLVQKTAREMLKILHGVSMGILGSPENFETAVISAVISKIGQEDILHPEFRKSSDFDIGK